MRPPFTDLAIIKAKKAYFNMRYLNFRNYKCAGLLMFSKMWTKAFTQIIFMPKHNTIRDRP